MEFLSKCVAVGRLHRDPHQWRTLQFTGDRQDGHRAERLKQIRLNHDTFSVLANSGSLELLLEVDALTDNQSVVGQEAHQ